MRMQSTLCQVCIFLAFSLTAAMVSNYVSPRGIPLVGQWDESRGVVTAGGRADVVEHRREIDAVAVAKRIYDSGEALFVDARSRADYETAHIKGAVMLPAGDFDTHIEDFIGQYPTETPIIAYCSGRACEDSHHVAQLLEDFGYTNVRVMIDGITVWQARGYPVE